MKRNTTIALFYTGVAAICIGILSISMWLRKGLQDPYQAPAAVNTGRQSVPEWFAIEKDLAAINQDDMPVKLSDLRGKVWLVAEFFAVCPHCALRNGKELTEIYAEFGKNPDFHIACISIDPETDKIAKLADYAKVLNADSKNWWFLNAGDTVTTHEYLEKTLKFIKVRDRIDPLEIESNGKYDHDMAFTLVDREFNVIGKWNLVGARSEQGKKTDPGLYDKMRGELFARIRLELSKGEQPSN